MRFPRGGSPKAEARLPSIATGNRRQDPPFDDVLDPSLRSCPGKSVKDESAPAARYSTLTHVYGPFGITATNGFAEPWIAASTPFSGESTGVNPRIDAVDLSRCSE